ncbi:hypothetical protein ABKJ49_003502 [Salmonella enterica subsp. enterica serovar Bareilly]|nr:hypothetical protein [Salmonella enterica subsp. enterica]EJD7639839.1 hypothetical protein [Salmonella enterica]
MYPPDRSQQRRNSQTKLLSAVRVTISASKYPVCLRDKSGYFQLCNPAFYDQIVSEYSQEKFWFESLDINLKLFLLKAEVYSASSEFGMFEIEELMVNKTLWRICIDYVSLGKDSYFIWRFIDLTKVVKSESFSSGELNLCSPLFNSLHKYHDILPYLLGFSHKYSSELTKISVSTSKKKTMLFLKENNLSSRDEFLNYISSSNIILCLYKKMLNMFF